VSNKGSATNRAETEQQAADYVVALSHDPSRQLQAEVAEWIKRSPGHAVAFARAERAWEMAGGLTDAPGLGATDGPASVAGSDPLLAPPRSRRGFLAMGAVAASVATGLAGFSWLSGRQKFETAVGEVRDVTLADGSRIHLNTNSRVTVAMSGKRRFVHLAQGEAYFDVAHNPAAPFEVEAQGTVVRALGTAFDVRVRADLIELTVTDGLVGVRTSEGATDKISAGNGALIKQHTVARTVLARREIEQRTIWREKVIELDGESLAQAVDEFNRYRTNPIVVGDPRIAPLRVGGRFQLDRADEFLAALRETLPVDAIAVSDGSILLTYRAGGSAPDIAPAAPASLIDKT